MKASLDLLEKFFQDCDQSNWGYSDSQITAAFWQIAYELRLGHNITLNMNECDHDLEELPALKCYVHALDMDGHELENLCASGCYYRIFIKDGVIFACLSDGDWDAATEPPCEDYAWLTATSDHREKIEAILKIPDLLWDEEDI